MDMLGDFPDGLKLKALEAILDLADEAIMITDGELNPPGPRILYVNRAFERMTGWSDAEVIGKTPRILQGPMTDRKELSRLKAALREGQPANGEIVNYHKSGSPFILQWQIQPLFEGQSKPRYFVAIQRDVTAIRREQGELIAAKERAASHAERLEAFAQTLAHDLRAPAGRLAIFAEMASKSDSNQKDTLQRINKNASDLVSTIDKLYQLISHRDVETSRVDVSFLARSIMNRLRLTAPNRIMKFVVEDAIVVDADPVLLRLILENLLSNAWKFTSETSSPQIEVSARREQERIWISVQDNGIGFDAEQASRLFTPFTRLVTKSEFEGTGLGLSIVKRLVTLLHGDVRARCAPGHGAVFEFCVPG